MPLQLKQDGINGADYHYSVFQKTLTGSRWPKTMAFY